MPRRWHQGYLYSNSTECVLLIYWWNHIPLFHLTYVFFFFFFGGLEMLCDIRANSLWVLFNQLDLLHLETRDERWRGRKSKHSSLSLPLHPPPPPTPLSLDSWLYSMTELVCLDRTYSGQNIVLCNAPDGHKSVIPISNTVNQAPV